MIDDLVVTCYDPKFYDQLTPQKEQCVIHMWCFDRDSNPHLIRIDDFYVGIFIEFFNDYKGRFVDWTPKKMMKIAQCMEDETGIEMRSYKPTQKILLYYYKVNPSCLLRARFNTRNQANTFVNHLKVNGLELSDGKMFFNFHETFVNPVQRFHNKYNIKFSGWFKIKGRRVRKKKCISVLEREYYGDRHTIVPVDPIKSETWKVRPLILSFDIETYSHNIRAFPDENDIRDPAFMVAFVVLRHGDPIENIVKIGLVYGDCPEDPYLDKLFIVNTEKRFIKLFYKILNTINADVYTGYNITGYDMHVLNVRTNVYCHMDIPLIGRLKFRPVKQKGYFDSSWGSSANKRVNVKCFNVPGVLILDPYHYVFRELPKRTSYRLADISQEWIGESKDPITPKFMFKTYRDWLIHKDDKTTPRYKRIMEKMKAIMHYCVIDCVRPLQLLDKFGLLAIVRERSSIFGVSQQSIFMFGTGKKTESQIVTAAHHEQYVINSYTTPIIRTMGAFVFPALTGMYNFVMTNDFNSLYPSIAIAFNLCYTTLLAECNRYDMDEDDYEVFPTGRDEPPFELCFVRPHIRKGVFPAILAKLLAARARTRKVLGTLTDPEQRKLYDNRQLALKIGANSGYGYTSSNYSSIQCKEIAETICAIGRAEIKKISNEIETVYKGKTVAGDTDSYMVSIDYVDPTKDPNAAFTLGKKIEVYMNGVPEKTVNGVTIPAKVGLFRPPLRMAVEGYRKMLIFKKKNYVYGEYITDPKDPNYGQLRRDENGKFILYIKGATPVKKENCAWVRNLFMDLCQLFFHECTFEDALNEIVRSLKKYLDGKIDPYDLVMVNAMGSNYVLKNAKFSLFSERLANAGTPAETGDSLEYVMIFKDSKYQGDKCYLITEYMRMLEKGEDVQLDDEFYIITAFGKVCKLLQSVYDPTMKLKWTSGRRKYDMSKLSKYFYDELSDDVKLSTIRKSIIELFYDQDYEIESVR